MVICLGNFAGLVALCFMFGCYIGYRGVTPPSTYSSGDEFLMWCQHMYEMDRRALYLEEAMFMLVIVLIVIDVSYYILHRRGS